MFNVFVPKTVLNNAKDKKEKKSHYLSFSRSLKPSEGGVPEVTFINTI